ncbi:MAG: glycosyl hydrolase [Ferruginibacter sp.]
MKKIRSILYLLTWLHYVLSWNVAVAQPVDKKANPQTNNLLVSLRKLLPKGILFGHQDDLAYGVGWKYQPGRSDIKDVTGEYPAVYGWDYAGLEKDSKLNIDGVPFEKMREYIKQGYNRGGVITVSWHLDNPLTGKNAWDTTHGGVAAILPGGVAHRLYTSWLDKVAAFSLSMRGSDGELIPILFRPFHELTGNWFWWTKNTCTPDQFKELWKFTFNYLTETKKVHNFIYVYNTAGNFTSKEAFLERYPGDEYVDIVSFDAYQFGDPSKDDSFVKQVQQQLSILNTVASEHRKVPAFGETGYEAIPFKKWWTGTLWKAIGKYPISYILLWRNHGLQENGNMHYYVPYKGQISEQDFLAFYKMKKMFFEKKAREKKLYKKN